jgi:hypothetical protein
MPNESSNNDFGVSSEQEYQDRRQELMEEAAETKQEHEQAQSEFLDAVADEHEAEIIETPVTLVGDHNATIRVKENGELMDAFGHIQEKLESAQENAKMYEVGEAADDAAQLLADILEEPEYDKQLFWGVYKKEGLTALGALLEEVSEGIQDERERQAGAAQGFRSPGKD